MRLPISAPVAAVFGTAWGRSDGSRTTSRPSPGSTRREAPSRRCSTDFATTGITLPSSGGGSAEPATGDTPTSREAPNRRRSTDPATTGVTPPGRGGGSAEPTTGDMPTVCTAEPADTSSRDASSEISSTVSTLADPSGPPVEGEYDDCSVEACDWVDEHGTCLDATRRIATSTRARVDRALDCPGFAAPATGTVVRACRPNTTGAGVPDCSRGATRLDKRPRRHRLLAHPVIAVPRPSLLFVLVLGCAHLVPPAAPPENGIPVVDTREKPLPEPVRVASGRTHGGCDTGAQCVEHLDPSQSVEDGRRTCEADGARWLTGACPHRGALSACITEHFLMFEYGKARADEFGNPLHRDLAAAREACLTQSGEFYELTP